MNSNSPSLGGWRQSLTRILATHNAVRQDGRTASYDTQRKRGDVLMLGFQQLREMKFRIEDVRSFKGRHMQALVDRWVQERLSPSVIQNRVSVFRQFASWIGKPGMIQASVHYVSDPALVTRSSIAKVDKSWSAHEIDPAQVMERVRRIDPRIAMALSLQWAFGLRVRESLLFRPWIADLGQWLDISRGTKNGRQRMVPVREPWQRVILDQAKAMVQGKEESIAGPELSLKEVRNRFYAVLRKEGICRKNGVTAHGLRHQAANDYFESLAGYPSPVRDGPAPADASVERYARLETAEFLGHSRESVTTHYLGR